MRTKEELEQIAREIVERAQASEPQDIYDVLCTRFEGALTLVQDDALAAALVATESVSIRAHTFNETQRRALIVQECRQALIDTIKDKK